MNSHNDEMATPSSSAKGSGMTSVGSRSSGSNSQTTTNDPPKKETLPTTTTMKTTTSPTFSRYYKDLLLQNPSNMESFSHSSLPTTSSSSVVVASSTKNIPASALSQALRRQSHKHDNNKNNKDFKSKSTLEALYRGIPVTKITAGKGTKVPRIVTLSKDHTAIFITHQRIPSSSSQNNNDNFVMQIANSLPIPFWTPSKGFSLLMNINSMTGRNGRQQRYVRYLDIADIDSIIVGVVNSTVLELFCSTSTQSLSKKEKDSIVTIYHHGMEESLNVLIENPTLRDGFVTTLQQLKSQYQSVIPWISNKALLLRYLWYHVDVDQNGTISIKELQHICDILNIVVDAKTYFQQQPNEKDKNKKNKKELTYDECLVVLHKIQRQLTQGSDWSGPLWQDLFHVDEKMTSQTSKNNNKTKGMKKDSTPPPPPCTTTTITTTTSSSSDIPIGTITPLRLWIHFLKDIQKEYNTTVEDAQELLQGIVGLNLDTELVPTKNMNTKIQSTSSSSSPSKSKTKTVLPSPETSVSITQPQWEEYLLSKFNAAYDPKMLQIPSSSSEGLQYYNHPISQYWINTSHNTYLLGDQLRSKSSVEAYTLALERGCKCLELDCWDGSTNTNTNTNNKNNNNNHMPVVFHGHTLTSKIYFIDILYVVQAYIQAHPNTLPIILSLENHCSYPFQTTMAQNLTNVFGHALYIPPISQTKGNVKTSLPSPQELRGKVVIKGKRPPEPDDETVVAKSEPSPPVIDNDDDDEDEDPYDEALQQVEPDDKGEPKTSKDTKSTKKNSKKKPKIVPELAALTLFHGTKFKSFEKSLRMDTSHMHSIGETKISKLVTMAAGKSNNGGDGSSSGGGSSTTTITGGDLWRQYNQEHMTRTYPAGFRIDSSNYNPILAWSMGCQLVALNFQSHDTPLLLNDGRFRQAGNGGYILKPPSINNKTTLDKNNHDNSWTLKLTIISGHCLPKPKGVQVGEAIDPYVKVELHDVIRQKDKEDLIVHNDLTTNIVSNNGFCPAWPSTSTKTTKTWQVYQPDVAMILFQILDDDLGLDDKIASSAIPVNALRQGYRSVQLFSGHKSNRRTGPFEYASLLVKIGIDKNEPQQQQEGEQRETTPL